MAMPGMDNGIVNALRRPHLQPLDAVFNKIRNHLNFRTESDNDGSSGLNTTNNHLFQLSAPNKLIAARSNHGQFIRKNNDKKRKDTHHLRLSGQQHIRRLTGSHPGKLSSPKIATRHSLPTGDYLCSVHINNLFTEDDNSGVDVSEDELLKRQTIQLHTRSLLSVGHTGHSSIPNSSNPLTSPSPPMLSPQPIYSTRRGTSYATAYSVNSSLVTSPPLLSAPHKNQLTPSDGSGLLIPGWPASPLALDGRSSNERHCLRSGLVTNANASTNVLGDSGSEEGGTSTDSTSSMPAASGGKGSGKYADIDDIVAPLHQSSSTSKIVDSLRLTGSLPACVASPSGLHTPRSRRNHLLTNPTQNACISTVTKSPKLGKISLQVEETKDTKSIVKKTQKKHLTGRNFLTDLLLPSIHGLPDLSLANAPRRNRFVISSEEPLQKSNNMVTVSAPHSPIPSGSQRNRYVTMPSSPASVISNEVSISSIQSERGDVAVSRNHAVRLFDKSRNNAKKSFDKTLCNGDNQVMVTAKHVATERPKPTNVKLGQPKLLSSVAYYQPVFLDVFRSTMAEFNDAEAFLSGNCQTTVDGRTQDTDKQNAPFMLRVPQTQIEVPNWRVLPLSEVIAFLSHSPSEVSTSRIKRPLTVCQCSVQSPTRLHRSSPTTRAGSAGCSSSSEAIIVNKNINMKRMPIKRKVTTNTTSIAVTETSPNGGRCPVCLKRSTVNTDDTGLSSGGVLLGCNDRQSEPLDTALFQARHAPLEADERRQERRSRQRQAELEFQAKLEARERESWRKRQVSRSVTGTVHDAEKRMPNQLTLSPFKIRRIEACQYIPVIAFGTTVPLPKNKYFSLP